MDGLELAEGYVRSTNVSVFLTGKAGSGKTTFLHHIAETVNKRCVVLAPTGVAAVNAGGVTIHSFFQLPLCPYLPDVKELVTEYQMPDKLKSLRKEKVNIIRTLDLIIIDEISMVRADLLDAVDMTLRRYRRSGKPFGGVQLLMIGDVQQLPPVVTEEERPYIERVYRSPFFFHSKALQQLRYVTIELTHIFRQRDASFIELLNRVRDNDLDDGTLAVLNGRCDVGFDPPDGEGYIRLTTHNSQADGVNRRKLSMLPSLPFVLRADVDGNFPESSFPTEGELILKKGAQVMFVKNDTSGGGEYYNGKIATVEGYDEDEGVAVVDTEGRRIKVHRERWENVRYEIDATDNRIRQKVDGRFVQYPLRLAWAITIHKSQGLTFDRVIIDASSAFSYGQVYVALSRCRTLEGITLVSPISRKCVYDNDDVLEFNRSFAPMERVRSELGMFRSAYYYEQLNELFDISAIYYAAERLNGVYQRHLRRSQPALSERMNDFLSNVLVNLLSVSERFGRQLARINISSGGDVNDALLKERVEKGVAFYGSQIDDILAAVGPLVEIEVNNKAVAAEVKEWSAELKRAIGLKQCCLKRVERYGFSTEVYNQAKVDFLLDSKRERGKGSRKKEPKQSKPRKAPVWVESLEMFLEGMDYKSIAERRGLALGTIEGHIQKALEAGAVGIDRLLSATEFDEIVEYMKEVRPGSLKEVYEHFDGRYTYSKIRAAAFAEKGM